MVNPWKTERQTDNAGMARPGPVSAINAAVPDFGRTNYERWLGVALWAGFVGVLLWNGAA